MTLKKKQVFVTALLLLGLLPFVTAYTEVQYSLDNTSWATAGITNNASITIEEANNGIDANTEYYLRLRHVFNDSSSDWAYTKVTTKVGGVDEMSLAIIIGLGMAAFLCLYFAFNVGEEHTLLKILLVFFSISLTLLIPSSILTSEVAAAQTFLKIILWVMRAVGLYLLLYFLYVFWLKSKLIDYGLFRGGKGGKR